MNWKLFPKKNLENTDQFAKRSYSQTGEDLIVKFIFDAIGISHPRYVDVGAHHPFYLSNTALFYENGSTGINIEPDPLLFEAFLKYRERDKNINIGIAADKGIADFYIMSSTTLNTFSKQEAENYLTEGGYTISKVTQIRTDSLTNVLDEVNSGKFPEYLSVDAEGIDELVISSIDFAINYPLVICIETISFSTSGNGIKNTALIDFISGKGYMVYADTHINTIFVREDRWKK